MVDDDLRAALETVLTALETPRRIEVHHYFHQPLRIVASEGPAWIKAAAIALSTATEETTMATTPTITVDQTGHLSLGFADDKGDVTAAPANTTVAYSVQPSVAGGAQPATTVAADPANPLGAIVTPGPDGDAGLFAATFNGTAIEPDGVTPIPDPAAIPFAVGPGGAVSATISETNS